MILALFRKDLRLTVPVLAAAFFLSFATSLCVFALIKTMAPGRFPWAEAILASVHYSQWLLVLVCALLGGNALACEQEDESILFLKALPARAGDVLFSKLIVTLLAFEVLWLASTAVVHAVAPFARAGYRDMLPGAANVATMAALSAMALGLSWLWSAVLSRPMNAAICGLSSSGLLCLASHIAVRLLRPVSPDLPSASLALPAAVVGALGIAGGIGLFRRERSTARTRPRRARAIGRGDGHRMTSASGGLLPGEGNRELAALAWKDWRLFRQMILGGVALVAMPYVYAALLSGMTDASAAAFARASAQSLWMCCGVFSVWGGYLAAAEERGGTARFLHAMPARRSHTTGSKLLVAGVPCLLLLGVNIMLAWVAHKAAFLPSPVDEPGAGFTDMTWSLLIWQQASLMFALPVIGAPAAGFGLAWLVSARFCKPFLGIAAGVAAAGVTVLMWVVFKLSVSEAIRPFAAAAAFAGMDCLLAGGCVVWGSRLLAKRESA